MRNNRVNLCSLIALYRAGKLMKLVPIRTHPLRFGILVGFQSLNEAEPELDGARLERRDAGGG
jgi:hypothetical protein